MAAPTVDQEMDSAELRALTEWMGLNVAALAMRWRCTEGSVKGWMKESRAVPAKTAQAVREMVEETEEALDKLIDWTEDQIKTDGEAVLLTYRSDREYRADRPDAPFNAAWHRMLCARVAEHIDDVRISYAVPAADGFRG